MALIYRMIELIETLWRRARYRYLPSERASGYRFHLVTGPTYAEMLFGGRHPPGGVEINEMSWELVYEPNCLRSHRTGSLSALRPVLATIRP
jgi:hypothetical protein